MVKNVSKVLSLLMSVVMLMGILSVPMTFTAAEPVQLSLGSAKGAAGDIVTIPFTISANSTAVIGQFKLSYDIYKLEYLGSEYSGLLDDNRDIISVVSSVATSSIAFGFRYGESSGITGRGIIYI
ncbi:MAG TPA: cohesin domain-containing protein [Clostridia bacterium]|nr:cohesin domain-containing protein [Clostridia bacterium]